MEIIPAIDIRGGHCVRLVEGDYERETVFDADPVEVAVRWATIGARRLHIVDLDGAREGRRVNAAIVDAIVHTVDCAIQTSGGVRDLETLQRMLDGGVQRVVLGTAALHDAELLRNAIAIAGERLIVSVDARDGVVRTDGWTRGTEIEARNWIDQLAAAGVERIVYTDIGRDGRLEGLDVEFYRTLAAATPLAVIAAGGVSTLDDVERLATSGVEAAIIGRAIYSGEIDLGRALALAG